MMFFFSLPFSAFYKSMALLKLEKKFENMEGFIGCCFYCSIRYKGNEQ